MYIHWLRILMGCFLVVALSVDTAKADKRFTLVIDAGHGGKDTGAPGNLTNEKQINLKVATALGKLIKSGCPDVKVIFTRTTDDFVSLQRRADIANNAKADLFISIHTNSLPNGRIARGSETYTLGMHRAAENLDVAKRENSVIALESDYKTKYQGFDPNKSESYVIFEFLQDRHMKESVELARCIQNGYMANGRSNRGVRQAGFLVLRETSMPSVLTEVGFISTPDEERWMNSTEGVNALARSIYDGFINYHKKWAKAAGKAMPRIRPVEVETPPAHVPDTATASSAVAEGKHVAPKNEKAKPTEPQVPTAPKKVETESAPATTAHVYRIQLLTCNRNLPASDARFKGLKDIFSYRHGGLYKFTTGCFETRQAAQKALRTVRQKFSDAFIVEFKGEERVR